MTNRRFSNSAQPLDTALNDLTTRLATHGTADFIGSAGNLQNVMSMESVDGAQLANARTSLNNARSNILAVLDNAKLSGKPSNAGVFSYSAEDAAPEANADASEENPLFTNAQLEAGAMVAVASEDPVAYAKAALDTTGSHKEGLINNTTAGDTVEMGYSDDAVSLEAYDDGNLKAYIPFSIMYNVLAARQGDFAEAFYPTLVVSPDQAGVEVSITRTMLYKEVRHQSSGKTTNFDRVNLLDAVQNPELLDNDSTRVYPVYQDGVNNDSFIDPAIVPPVSVTPDNLPVDTLPLLPGMEHNLLGLGQAAILGLQGELDSSDQLAHPVRLDDVYLRVTNKDGEASVIRVNVRSLPFSQFHKAQEGLDREVQLNFRNTQLMLSADTKDITGAPAAALQSVFTGATADHMANFRLTVTGNGNLEFGTIFVETTTGRVESVQLRTGDRTYEAETSATVIDAVKGGIKSIEFICFTLDLYRTNYNRRQRGTLVESTLYSERYATKLGSPITAITPPTDTRTATDLIAPVTATRIRNDNNAITKLFAYAETLDSLMVSYDKNLPRPEIEGISRHIIVPFYEHKRISMHNHLQSLRSADKPSDVNAVLVNIFKEVSYRALRDSNYEAALTAQTGVVGQLPRLLIGTNPVVAKHLMVNESGRLDTIKFDTKIVTTVDKRLGAPGTDSHEVFMTFTRPGTQLDPLSFGQFLWCPELVTTIQTSRNGGVSNEVMVQPRTYHMQMLPILMRITIDDLGDSLTGKTAIRTEY